MGKFLKKYSLLLIFGIFLVSLTIVDMCMNAREYSDLENKKLAQKPAFTLQKFFDNEFTPEYEEYINDQFAFRDTWISMKSVAEAALGKQENNNIIYGKAGQMFERFDSYDASQYEKNLQNLLTFLQKHEEDFHTSAMIVPNAYAIYPEKLPLGVKMINQLPLLEDIEQRVTQSGGSAINLYERFCAEKEQYLYYRTDHHWTTKGAYIAYEELMKSLGMQPVAYEDVPMQEAEDFLGTYYSKSKSVFAKPDVLVYQDIPVQLTYDGKTFSSVYNPSSLEGRDKYGGFLYGNNGLTVIRGDELGDSQTKKERILVVKDSYANALVPYLLYNYKEVVVVDLRYFGLSPRLSEYLEQNAFDDVLILYNLQNFCVDFDFGKIIL